VSRVVNMTSKMGGVWSAEPLCLHDENPRPVLKYLHIRRREQSRGTQVAIFEILQELRSAHDTASKMRKNLGILVNGGRVLLDAQKKEGKSRKRSHR